MQKKRNFLIIGAAALFALSACYEPADVTMHQPGVYKGPTDPLLSENAEQRRETLMARFNQGQRDR